MSDVDWLLAAILVSSWGPFVLLFIRVNCGETCPHCGNWQLGHSERCRFCWRSREEKYPG